MVNEKRVGGSEQEAEGNPIRRGETARLLGKGGLNFHLFCLHTFSYASHLPRLVALNFFNIVGSASLARPTPGAC